MLVDDLIELRNKKTFLQFNRIVTHKANEKYMTFLKGYSKLSFLFSEYESPKNIQFSWHFYNNIFGIKTCEICGEKANLLSTAETKYNKIYKRSCDNISCGVKIKENTNLKLYGVKNTSQSEETKNKKIKTCRKNFGCDFPSQSKEVISKIENTYLEKYGNKKILKCDIIKEKIKKTNNSLYGFENVSCNSNIKQKKSNTCIDRYGVDNPFKIDKVKRIISEKLRKFRMDNITITYNKSDYKFIDINHLNELTLKCEICGENFTEHKDFIMQRRLDERVLCTHCNPYRTYSQTENKLSVFIKLLLENISIMNIENCNSFKEFYHLLNIKSNKDILNKILIDSRLEFLKDGYSSPQAIQFIWHFYNSKFELERCKYCNKPSKLIHKSNLNKGSNIIYQNTCGDIECINLSKKDSIFNKYGVDNISQLDSIKEKKTKLSLLKYGVDNISKSGIIKDKKKKSYYDKFGCDNVLQNDEIKRQIRETNIEKYGCAYVLQNEIVKNKIKKTNLDRYGFNVAIKNNDIRDKMLETKNYITQNRFGVNGYEFVSADSETFMLRCPKCNQIFKVEKKFINQRLRLGYELCTNCNPYKINSQTENKIAEFIQLLKCDMESSNRSILNGKEIDIYIPSLNIGFEFNGVYWHSEKFKKKHYHQEKKFQASEQGVNLIHIWEDDWEYKRPIIEARIKNVLGVTENKIFARKCTIVEVDSKTSKAFLEQNHIQGQVGAKRRLGLIYDGNLVSLMTFGVRNGKMEMLRFCNKLNFNVVGGFSRLLKHFRKDFTGEIYSYADLDWSNPKDNVYLRNGFTFVKKTEPGYFWVKNDRRYARQQFQKHKLVAQGFDVSKTEDQIMIERGYVKIYNSGNLLYMI